MSWLLFLDESGHDHRTMPYEVHGGVALHASQLWPFIQAVRTLEQSVFGAHLHEFGSEIKGSKLLESKRFAWAAQSGRFDDSVRRKHVLNFLNSSRQGRAPRRDEFTAYGQACIQFVEGVVSLLLGHDAALFAAMIPPIARPQTVRADVPRKDIVFLLERYFYFLKERGEMGLLVMDCTDKASDRVLIRQLERYFTEKLTGASRSRWVVPVPLFVESDMAYGVQVADICVYCLNWAKRVRSMDSPIRAEIRPFVEMLGALEKSAQGRRNGKHFRTRSVFFVPDPYTPRSVQKEKKEARPLELP